MLNWGKKVKYHLLLQERLHDVCFGHLVVLGVPVLILGTDVPCGKAVVVLECRCWSWWYWEVCF